MRKDDSFEDLPEHFYKYRPLDTKQNFDRVIEIITENKIYCSSPNSLNDPFDCRPCFDFSGSKRDLRREKNRLEEKLGLGMNRAARRKGNKNMFEDPVWNPRAKIAQAKLYALYDIEMNKSGVFCMSARNNDILMWAHYADAHRGVCLQFSKHNYLMHMAQRVLYSKTRPVIPQFFNVDPAVSFERAMLTKSEHWCYEEEWRLVRTEEGHGYAKFSSEDLTGIIFGAQTPQPDIERIQELVAHRVTPISLLRSQINRKDYQIKIIPL